MLELQTQEILIYDPNTGQHVSVPAFGASGGAATVDPTLTIPGAAADAAAAGAALQELSEKVAVGTGSYALIADITIIVMQRRKKRRRSGNSRRKACPRFPLLKNAWRNWKLKTLILKKRLNCSCRG